MRFKTDAELFRVRLNLLQPFTISTQTYRGHRYESLG